VPRLRRAALLQRRSRDLPEARRRGLCRGQPLGDSFGSATMGIANPTAIELICIEEPRSRRPSMPVSAPTRTRALDNGARCDAVLVNTAIAKSRRHAQDAAASERVGSMAAGCEPRRADPGGAASPIVEPEARPRRNPEASSRRRHGRPFRLSPEGALDASVRHPAALRHNPAWGCPANTMPDGNPMLDSKPAGVEHMLGVPRLPLWIAVVSIVITNILLIEPPAKLLGTTFASSFSLASAETGESYRERHGIRCVRDQDVLHNRLTAVTVTDGQRGKM